MTRACRWALRGCLALGAVFGLTEPARAARLLEAYVEHEGKVVVHTFYDDDGRADPATVWRYLRNSPIMVDEQTTDVRPSPDNPLEATLEGDVCVRVQHTTRVIARAHVSSLRLRRWSGDGRAWYLPPEEVERTAAVAGLGPPTPPARLGWARLGRAVIGWAGIALCLGLLVITVWLARPRRGPGNPAP